VRESDIEKYLVKRVKALGGEVRKVQWIGRRGAPDRLVMLPATWVLCDDNAYRQHRRTAWVELKAPGEAPDPHQAREHRRMREMGERVVVIDSVEGVERLVA
jgi:hypothetical protein